MPGNTRNARSVQERVCFNVELWGILQESSKPSRRVSYLCEYFVEASKVEVRGKARFGDLACASLVAP